jgi:hypothetical protein
LFQEWLDEDVSHCSLETNSWEDLVRNRTSGAYTLATGSLIAPKRIPGVYDTWVCVKGYKRWMDRCAADTGATSDDHYCFVFLDAGDSIHGTFVPWGTNKKLRLVQSTCNAA